MQYGNVYVAQVAMGADYSQTLRALLEAESYPGTSIIIAYAPCISHGIKIGMNNTMLEMKAAVQAGYWHLFRYDPRRKEKGRKPFQLDSPAPIMDYQRGPLFLPSAHLPGTGHRALCPGGEGGAGEICASGRAEQALGGQGRLSPDWKRIHILKIKIQGDRQCSVKDLPVFLSTTEEVAGREKEQSGLECPLCFLSRCQQTLFYQKFSCHVVNRALLYIDFVCHTAHEIVGEQPVQGGEGFLQIGGFLPEPLK